MPMAMHWLFRECHAKYMAILHQSEKILCLAHGHAMPTAILCLFFDTAMEWQLTLHV